MRLNHSSINRFSRLLNFKESAATIGIENDSTSSSSNTSVTITEMGWLFAYVLIAYRAGYQLTTQRRSFLQSLRTALGLLRTGQFGESLQRIIRRSGHVHADTVSPLAADNRIFRSPRKAMLHGGLLRVVIFSHNLNLEGAPISQFELVAELSSCGEIDPIVVAPSDGPLHSRYAVEDIPVFILPQAVLDTNKDEGDYDQAVTDFGRAILELHPDIIYANSAEAFLIIDTADRLNLPCIWNIRESDSPETRFGGYSLRIRQRALACLALADKVIFVSEASKLAWQPLPDGCNATVIPNALDPNRQKTARSEWNREIARESLMIEADEISLICVGTLCERKGQNDIIRAVAQLSDEQFTKLRIDLIGRCGDTYGQGVALLIKKLPKIKQARFRIFDATEHIEQHYIAADIFVCSSRVESYPRVVLEAMSCRLAIISTPAFGIKEQLADGETALFYAPGDTNALAGHIAKLIDDDDTRKALGSNAIKSLEKLISFPDMIHRYGAIFREIAGAGTTQP